MDWIITIPQTTDWIKYLSELEDVKDYKKIMSYRLSYQPKQMQVGDRMFITYKGNVKGWMFITGIKYKKGFICETTLKQWPDGYYVERSGPFYQVYDIKYPGFRGIRKYQYKQITPLTIKESL